MGKMLVVLLLCLSSTAYADTGDAALAKMDEAMNRAEDQYFEYTIVDQQPGKDERRMAMEVSLKGEKRFTKFTAPADVKGTKVLILSPTQMYVYLPAFKKVRRIASHVTAQGFMGTTYSSDDMSLVRFADKYDAKLAKDSDKTLELEITKKSDVAAPYPKGRITIDKKLMLPIELAYFNDKGQKLKTETRIDYGCEGTVCTARVMKMVDHTANGHWTELVREKWKVNSGLSKRTFSKRNLQRGG